MRPSAASLALSCGLAASSILAAPAPFPAPEPAPLHAVGSHLLSSVFDDADLVAVSDRLSKRDLDPRHAAAAASGKSMKFRFSQSKRNAYGRHTKRFTRRQANGTSTGSEVDDESELLNFQDIR